MSHFLLSSFPWARKHGSSSKSSLIRIRTDKDKETPRRLVTHTLQSPTPRVSDSVDLGSGMTICIFNQFLYDAGAAGPGTTGDHTTMK